MFRFIFRQCLQATLLVLVGSSFQKELFYIYNSTEWNEISQSPLRQRAPNEVMDVVLNYGAGPLIDESLSLYHTDQYALFQLIYNRAVKDSRRTLDPSKARLTALITYSFTHIALT
jgi:hypothetical protein